jgi:hypothetical protein
MAWEGAFGLVPQEADNCVMSGTFAVYEPIEDKIAPKFLDYYFKIEKVWKSIGSQSTGTNVRRRSLHPTQFEKALIPLPSLPEQRRIVAKIEALAAKIERAFAVRREATKEAYQLYQSQMNLIFSRLASKYPVRPFGSFDHHVTSGPRYWGGDKYSEHGFRFYRAQDIGPDGNVLSTSKAYVIPPEGQQGRTATVVTW